MIEKPKTVYVLVMLWIALSAIFVMWGIYSLYLVLEIPSWTELGALLPQLHFGYLISTIVWFVFSSLFIIFSYGTLKGDDWVWKTGIIITTIFLAIFGLMLAALMVNAIMFLDWFSVAGLVTVVLSFIIDLGIIFYLTRPAIKIYFEAVEKT